MGDHHGTSMGLVDDNLALETEQNPNQDLELANTADKNAVLIENGQSAGQRTNPSTAAAKLANAKQRTRQLEIEIITELQNQEQAERAASTNKDELEEVQITSLTKNTRLDLAREVNTKPKISKTAQLSLTSDIKKHMHKYRDLAERANKTSILGGVFIEAEILTYSSGVPKAAEVESSKQKALKNIITNLGIERGRALNKHEVEFVRGVFEKEYKLEREAFRDLELKYLVDNKPRTQQTLAVQSIAAKYSDLKSSQEAITQAHNKIEASDVIEEIRNLGRAAQNESAHSNTDYKHKLNSLMEKHGDLLTRDQVIEEFKKGAELEAKRQHAVKIREIEKQAASLAKEDYKDNPNEDAAKKILLEHGALSKDGVILDKALFDAFNNKYTTVRNELWDDLSLIEKGWHGAGNLIDRGVTWLQTDCKEGIMDFCTGVAEIVDDLIEWGSHSKNWKQLGSDIVDGAQWLCGKMKDGCVWLVENGLEAFVYAINPLNWPEMAVNTWEFLKEVGIQEFFTGIIDFAKSNFLAVFEFGKTIVTTGVLAIGATLGIIPWQKVRNNFSKGMEQAGQHFGNACKAIGKAFEIAWDIMGFKDAVAFFTTMYEGVVLYGQGRKEEAALAFKKMAMHFLFAGPRLILSFATLGIGNTAFACAQRLVIKTFMKKAVYGNALKGSKLFLSRQGVGVGERIFNGAKKNLDKALEEATPRAIKNVNKKLHKIVAKGPTGAKKETSKIVAKEFKIVTQEALEKSGVTGQVTREMSDLLLKIEKLTGKELHQELMKNRAIQLGIKDAKTLSFKKLAKALGKKETKALKKQMRALKIISCNKKAWLGKNGVGRQLEKDIIEDVQQRTLELSKGAKKQWDEYVDTLKKSHDHLDDDMIRAIREGGHEGIEKGIREGVRKPLSRAIRRGIKEGLKRARAARKKKLRRRHTAGLGASKKEVKAAGNTFEDGVFALNGTDFTHEQLSEFKFCGYDREGQIKAALSAVKKAKKDASRARRFAA